jgi:hypothetical protein
VVHASRTEPGLCDREPAALLAEDIRAWDADIVEVNLAVTLLIVEAEHEQVPNDLHAGASIGTSTMLCWRWGGPSRLVLPMTIDTRQRSLPAPEIHHLRPLMM